MLAGGKSMAGLAIPGAIISGLGLMMFIQNLTGYWQSWAYSWTIILVLVGLGIFIMGLYTEDLQRRQAGLRVMKVGAILFIIFGGFFELILNAFRPYGIQQYLFPVLLVALGIYLVVVRSGMLSSRRIDANNPTIDLSEVKK
jgi:multisubunit Na+/H+ antiporter MnhC subunit